MMESIIEYVDSFWIAWVPRFMIAEEFPRSWPIVDELEWLWRLNIDWVIVRTSSGFDRMRSIYTLMFNDGS